MGELCCVWLEGPEMAVRLRHRNVLFRNLLHGCTPVVVTIDKSILKFGLSVKTAVIKEFQTPQRVSDSPPRTSLLQIDCLLQRKSASRGAAAARLNTERATNRRRRRCSACLGCLLAAACLLLLACCCLLAAACLLLLACCMLLWPCSLRPLNSFLLIVYGERHRCLPIKRC